MALCKKCNAIIPDNRKYCNNCLKEIENPDTEDYLDNLLNNPETTTPASSDEQLDSMLAANIAAIEDSDIEDLEDAFNYLISDSDDKYEKAMPANVEAFDDINILEQIIDNFEYDEGKETSSSYNYDSVIDEVLESDDSLTSDYVEGTSNEEMEALLDTDFFSNLAATESSISDMEEFEPYDEESIYNNEINDISEVAKAGVDGEEELLSLLSDFDNNSSDDEPLIELEEADDEPLIIEDFVSSDDIEALLNSLGDELGEEVVLTEEQKNGEPPKVEKPFKKKKEKNNKKSFKEIFISLFANKDEQVSVRKQSDIGFEEEELKNQLKTEKEERKKIKAELKKVKEAEKATKKEEKERAKAEKKAQKANREVEVVLDEGKINKVGATIVVVFGAAICGLIILGINLFSYGNTISRAQKYYEQGQYDKAYTEIAGIELKEDDMAMYYELRTIYKLSTEYDYYESLLKVNKKDDAFFHLVKGLRKYDENIDKAKEYEVDDVYDELYKEIIKGFEETFSIKEEEALEISKMSDNDVVKLIEQYK